jgi:hypothetical protein
MVIDYEVEEISLQRLKKSETNHCQDGRSAGQNFKPGLSEYKSKVPSTPLRRSNQSFEKGMT